MHLNTGIEALKDYHLEYLNAFLNRDNTPSTILLSIITLRILTGLEKETGAVDRFKKGENNEILKLVTEAKELKESLPESDAATKEAIEAKVEEKVTEINKHIKKGIKSSCKAELENGRFVTLNGYIKKGGVYPELKSYVETMGFPAISSLFDKTVREHFYNNTLPEALMASSFEYTAQEISDGDFNINDDIDSAIESLMISLKTECMKFALESQPPTIDNCGYKPKENNPIDKTWHQLGANETMRGNLSKDKKYLVHIQTIVKNRLNASVQALQRILPDGKSVLTIPYLTIDERLISNQIIARKGQDQFNQVGLREINHDMCRVHIDNALDIVDSKQFAINNTKDISDVTFVRLKEICLDNDESRPYKEKMNRILPITVLAAIERNDIEFLNAFDQKSSRRHRPQYEFLIKSIRLNNLQNVHALESIKTIFPDVSLDNHINSSLNSALRATEINIPVILSVIESPICTYETLRSSPDLLSDLFKVGRENKNLRILHSVFLLMKEAKTCDCKHLELVLRMRNTVVPDNEKVSLMGKISSSKLDEGFISFVTSLNNVDEELTGSMSTAVFDAIEDDLFAQYSIAYIKKLDDENENIRNISGFSKMIVDRLLDNPGSPGSHADELKEAIKQSDKFLNEILKFEQSDKYQAVCETLGLTSEAQAIVNSALNPSTRQTKMKIQGRAAIKITGAMNRARNVKNVKGDANPSNSKVGPAGIDGTSSSA